MIVVCCALSYVFKPFGLSSRKQSENTTSLNKGTSLETIERQNAARIAVFRTPKSGGGGQEEARGQNGTPSMMEDVDDNAPMGHVSKQIKVGIDEDGVPFGSPNRMMTMPSLRRKTPWVGLK